MTARQQQAMGIFVREKYAPPGAAAIVGAMSGESGINLDATVNRLNADHGSGGIAEWRLDRKTKMVSFVHSLGKPAEDLDGQCQFVIYELARDYPNLDAELRRGSREGMKPVQFITTMCWNFVEIFERPNMAVAHMDDIRVPQAIKAYNTYMAEAHKTMPPVAQGGAGGAVIAGGGAIATAGQVPPWATITMAGISGLSALISYFNVKSKPVPLPIPEVEPETPVSEAPALSKRDIYRIKKEKLKAALAEFSVAQLEFREELARDQADLDDDPSVKMNIEHEPKAATVAIPKKESV